MIVYTGKKILKHIVFSAVLLSLYAGSAVPANAAAITSPFSNTISDKELDQDRGTYAPAISNQAISDISANITGGVDTNTVSGTNLISGGAFSNANGFITVIENSGNNVNIQSALTANVTFVNPVSR